MDSLDRYALEGFARMLDELNKNVVIIQAAIAAQGEALRSQEAMLKAVVSNSTTASARIDKISLAQIEAILERDFSVRTEALLQEVSKKDPRGFEILNSIRCANNPSTIFG